MEGMMLAQAANPSSTKVLPREAASCSEAAVTKMIKNPRATVFLNLNEVPMNPCCDRYRRSYVDL